jgi:hypothetical protein
MALESACFHVAHVAKFSKYFQRLPISPGSSMQHERDIDSQNCGARFIYPTMLRPAKSVRRKPTAAKLQTWRLSIIRKRGQYLGAVEAPNENAAETAAVAEFDLSAEQRQRLVVSERD